MNQALLIALALGGIVTGACLAWLLLRAKLSEAKTELQAQAATLQERLSYKETQIQELQSSLTTRDGQIRNLTQQIQTESNLRSVAETLNQQIPTLQKQLEGKACELTELQKEITELKALRSQLETTLEKERKSEEQIEKAKVELSNYFKALSSEALRSNNQSFLELAKGTLEKFQESAKGDLEKKQQAIDQLVKPVQESLLKFDAKIQEIENARVGAYEGLKQKVQSLLESEHKLQQETANLARALRIPQVRGRWGEIQLKRVVEMVGMLDHCDFYEQSNVTTEEGRFRPDMVVKLPGGQSIVIDAKVPLSNFLEAAEAPDEATQKLKLKEHARQVRDHATLLSRKSYWEQFQPAPEFVILFLPGENFYSAALQQDPTLIEQNFEQKVILATPTSLIGLLRGIAHGWRQQKLTENAQAISELGKELYKRIATLGEHFDKLGRSLRLAVDSYNRAVGSLEARVLPMAREFQNLEAASTQEEIKTLLPLDTLERQLSAPEFGGVGFEEKLLEEPVEEEMLQVSSLAKS